jgi:hypothetical protein
MTRSETPVRWKYLWAFCGDPARGDGHPFSQGSYSYATDRIIAVRVPRIGSFPSAMPTKERNMTVLPWPEVSRDDGKIKVHGNNGWVQLKPLSEIALPEKQLEPCECVATGLDRACWHCHGRAYVERPQSVRIDKRDANAAYIRMIRLWLHGAMLLQDETATQYDPFRIIYDQGECLLMPMLPNAC